MKRDFKILILGLIYIIFQFNYDIWMHDFVNHKIIYFAFQYGWVGALFLLEARKNAFSIFFYPAGLLMLITAGLEFRGWNTDIQTYAMMVSPPPITVFSIAVVAILFLIIIFKKLKI
jgi:hypothetical protein